MRDYIHQKSHEVQKRGIWKINDVNTWIVEESERIRSNYDTREEHEDAIQRVLNAQKDFIPQEHSLVWNYEEAPILSLMMKN